MKAKAIGVVIQLCFYHLALAKSGSSSGGGGGSSGPKPITLPLKTIDRRKIIAKEYPLKEHLLTSTFTDWTRDEITEFLAKVELGEGPHQAQMMHLSHALNRPNLRSSFGNFEGEIATVTSWFYYYTVDFQLGTPAQERTLMIDSGSSWMWTWADECPDDSDLCNPDPNLSFDSLSPPSDRFHIKDSSTFRYTGEDKFIQYGKGQSSGPICQDLISLKDRPETRADQFEFFVQLGQGSSTQDGILGLAPRDESAGPLLIEYLFAQGTIPATQFSILLSRAKVNPSSMTFGGYEEDGGDFFDAKKHSFTSHRVSGSFHWEVKVNKIGFKGEVFRPKNLMMLTDTGTTISILPKEDWDNLYRIICEQLEPAVVCNVNNGYRFLERVGIASIKLDPIQFQVDNVIYSVPFNRFFEYLSDDRLVLNEWSVGDKTILGMSWLDTFYQAYDMKRNQIALVVNINNAEDLEQPVVLERQSVYVIMSAGTVMVACILMFTTFKSEIDDNGNLGQRRPVLLKVAAKALLGGHLRSQKQCAYGKNQQLLSGMKEKAPSSDWTLVLLP